MEGYIQKLRRTIGHQKIIHPAARIVLENKEGEFLFIRRRDNNQWGLVAGAFEEGEDISQCICREVREETGLEITKLEAIGISTKPALETYFYPNGDVVQYFTVVFYSNSWTGELALETDEAKEIRFFPPGALPPIAAIESPSFEWLARYKAGSGFILA